MLFSKNSRVCNNGKYKKYSGYLKCADSGCSMYRKKAQKLTILITIVVIIEIKKDVQNII